MVYRKHVDGARSLYKHLQYKQILHVYFRRYYGYNIFGILFVIVSVAFFFVNLITI